MASSGKKFEVNGFVAPGFEKVAETFKHNLDSGVEKGGNFAAYYKGELVVNIWAGYSDNDCRRLWKEDTLSTFFSSTKAVAAFVIAHMVDRGLLEYKEKVSKYWPAFAQNGKENVTLEQLISNQAGLISLDKKYWLAEMRDDPDGLSQKLAEQKPYWSPGTKHGYHPLTFGLYLDQVVRHADPKHRTLSQYFKEEIAEPFNIEFYIGLPKSLFHRATRVQLSEHFTAKEYAKRFAQFFKGDPALLKLTNTKAARDFGTVSLERHEKLLWEREKLLKLSKFSLYHYDLYPTRDIELYIGLPKELYHRATRVSMYRDIDNAAFLKVFRGDLDLLMATANNPQDFKTTLKMNDPDIRELPVPSTNGHGTAANMAKLFGIVANDGTLNGKRMMSEKVIRKFTQPIVAGIDASFGMDAAWSLGTHLITTVTGAEQPNQIFGHGGYGGQYAASDIKHKVGFAYTTNFLDPFSSYNSEGDPRLFSLFKTLYECVNKLEGNREPMLTFKFYSKFKKYMDEHGIKSQL